MRVRALFFLWKTPRGNAVMVVDRNGDVSVTNDAEAVVQYVISQYGPEKRIIYRDTTGQWDELKHNGAVFTGFSLMTDGDLKEFSS